MKMNDRKRIVFAQARQFWRAFAYVMQVHENCYIKRAGEAGIALRASRVEPLPKEPPAFRHGDLSQYLYENGV
ncbi:hypothetical protein KGP23_02345 [Serratia ureilytica]|uniref:hypothetical protein n=1 Tax=Serratia ureilytica TaxID=300181 RepID=UPI001CBD0E5C|nr:hypothetical protein [Serratia ureilytica]UAN29720.1 hypothetical protein KGP23_02345 [Serratia ureilytica]